MSRTGTGLICALAPGAADVRYARDVYEAEVAYVDRCLGALLSAACLGLGYLWCLVDRRGRYWHDYLSHKELILLPKREKKKPSISIVKTSKRT